MKLSVSVPDDLWSKVHNPATTGPSETVQAGLALLADHQALAQRPMANAPDQANLDRYRDAFEGAVTKLATSIQEVRSRGYRLGLKLAPSLSVDDFDLLDQPALRQELRYGLETWGEDWEGIAEGLEDTDGSDLSFSFWQGFGELVQAIGHDEDQVSEVFGDEDAQGVKWKDYGDGLQPFVHDTFLLGIIDAFKDVRDEAMRRIAQDAGGDR